MTEEKNVNDFGRVDADGTVYVKEAAGERAVGQFADGTPAEALQYFVRKYDDLAGEITLLEARIARGTANAQVTQSVAKLAEQLVEPAAVGDLDALRTRVSALQEKAAEFAAAQKAEREEARAKAVAAREEIAAEAERLAAQPEDKIRWKETAEAFEALFAKWQESQRTMAQVPKSIADPIWKRFRTARSTFDAARRRYYAGVDANNKAAKEQKEKLITRAEALAAKGADGVNDYRALLEEWKRSPRGSRKIEDALWTRFRAAGDVLYGARAEAQAVVDEEFKANLAAKEELLTKAEALLKETDHKQARKALTEVQARWDEIGRVPRENVKTVEGRIRAIEDHVKQLEDDHWKATDPEQAARSAGLRGQLESSIAQLEADLAAAKGTQKAELEAKLATQREWLKAIG